MAEFAVNVTDGDFEEKVVNADAQYLLILGTILWSLCGNFTNMANR